MTGLFQRIKSNLSRLRVSDELEEFATANGAAWDQFFDEQREKDGYILVDATLSFPDYVMPHGTVANFIAREENIQPLFYAGQYRDRAVRRLAESYGAAGPVHATSRWLNPIRCVSALIDSVALFRQVSSKQELRELEYSGILIGDLVYNTYLRRTGHGTIQSFGSELFRDIYTAVLYSKYYNSLFDEYDIRKVLYGHPFYIQNGVLARTAIDRGIEVYIRVIGPRHISIKKCTTPEEVRTIRLRPSRELFDHVYENYREQAIESAESYLSQRMDGDNPFMNPGAAKAYADDKELIDESSIFEQYDIDPEKPVVVIMSHNFTDAVHNSDSLLFDDYLSWVRETLEFAVDHDAVNWLVKPHPNAEFFDTNQNVRDVTERIVDGVDDHTVRVLPDDIHTKSLLDFADALVTAKGSAGFEFPCFGMPVILAAESAYSGFGYTFDADSKSEYFELLETVPQQGPISEERIERAKTMAYIQWDLIRVQTDLIPHVSQGRDFDADEVWQRAADHIRGLDPGEDSLYPKLQRFLNNDYVHLINDDQVGLAGSSDTNPVLET